MIPEAATSYTMSLTDLVLRSTPAAKFVLLCLLIFSIISWAITLQKFLLYRSAKKGDKRFLSVFAKTKSLNNIYNISKELRHSPLARIFLPGYHELYIFQELTREEREKRQPSIVSREITLSSRDLKGVGIALEKAINREIERLGKRLEFLATTGSTTPFVGLFGTVWGIMHSFRAIGVKGSASIGGVAPGIAEALIATAAGLAAAIPAVIFYNYFSNKIRWFSTQMDDFSHDFIYMAEKNFLR
ncbi:MAG: MotA/TolQ/ExbB proton channel family protein [Nitrospinales bacterium]